MLSRLHALDVQLFADGERLRVSAPAGALDTAWRAEIAHAKKDLLDFLRRAGAKAPAPAIPRLPDDEPAPLSFAQERLWLLQQLQPESHAYNLCRAVRISGPLDAQALERGLSEVQRRHESLRTKFIAVDGRPSQVVGPAEKSRFATLELRHLPRAMREIEAERVIRNEARRPFDLSQGRLLRICLLRLRDDEHILAFMTHHIAADAWSMGILVRELWAFYDNFRADRPAEPAEISCRYCDYAAWQRGNFAVFKPQLDYWKAALAGVPVLDLPVDYARGAVPGYRGARVSIGLPQSLTSALNELSRRESATLFMTLLAALQVLLWRWSGQDDVAVGAPAANRERRELENVLGLFVNTLVLRTDLSGAPSFRALLRRAREVCLGAYVHQAVPFEALVQELNPQRGLDRHPLFQVMLVLQNTPSPSPRPAGLSLAPLEIDSEAAPFDLSLYLRERRGRLVGYFEYAADLFARSTIERMAGHFGTLLKGIVADPDQPIAMLPLLSAAERRQLAAWNNTPALYPKDACIHGLFEIQARRTPDAVALECGRRKMTYRELNSRANRLARQLRKKGAGAGQPVAILAERSLETIAGILAILKAGAAYLPVDPQYPRKRLLFMVADSGVKILLTRKKFARCLCDFSGSTFFIDDLLRGAAGETANLGRRGDSESGAYVIYTSGSTGIPKGVTALHRGAINRFSWMWKTYPFEAGEKICQKASLSFVDSVWEMFGALLQGVPTVIIPDAFAGDPRLLVEHLAAHAVTRLALVPSLLQSILDRCPDIAHRLACLKYCFSSGESLSSDLARRFSKALPGCRLINLYGSSEVAGDVAYYETRGDDESAMVPIGRPIHNTQIHILDQTMQHAPIGARGELYVAGDNLARGYLNRPELNAERFVTDPFTGAGAARLFRTGDMARYRADGNLEFLGRIDQQIKIRGRRIELGEIESALRAHPAVRECVVTARAAETETVHRKSKIQNLKLNNFLVAYTVPGDGRPAVAQLRAFLQEKLPDYMLPTAFVFLDAMPLLPNGKIDRAALPAPSQAPDRIVTSGAPRTEAESLIAGVWRQTLKIDGISLDGNFFELGGHSLLAAEAVARLRDTFARPVVLRDLFEAPTVAALARVIEKRLQEDTAASLPAIVSARRKRLLSPGQQPLFVFSQLFGGGDFLNLPYAYRLSGKLEVAALHRAFAEILRRHAVLRTGFRDSAAGPKPWLRRSAPLDLPLVDLAALPGAERQSELERISKQDARQSFDLEQPPLLRIKLLRLEESEHVLLVTTHHIISDQWSMGILRAELGALYRAFSKALPSPLPEPPFQFSDFACWQRKMLHEGRFKPLISYWQKRLAAPSPPLVWRGAKKAARYRSARRPLEFDEALFVRIKLVAGELNCTPFMIFAAGLATLLHHYTGANDIRIGTLVANRGQPGTEALIGYFVNALILRTAIRPSMSFAQVIGQVRQTCIDAFAHQDLPFEYLEKALANRNGKGPLYQVMLNYRNLSTPALEANGLTIASWDGKHRAEDPGIAIARLDVNFHLRELPTRLTGAVTYKTDLFDDKAIAKFLDHFKVIIERIVEDRHGRISAVKADSTI